MIMLVDIDENKITIDELNKEAEIVGNEIGVKIIIQHEDIFNAMYRV
jgi:ACT domain-containing protein